MAVSLVGGEGEQEAVGRMVENTRGMPHRSHGRRASIRLRLVLLILLVTVPVSVERLVSLLNQRADDISDMQDILHNLAVRAALAQQEAFASTAAIVEVLSRGASLLLNDPVACQRITERLNGEVGGIQGVYLANPQGRILCASPRSAVGMDLADTTYVTRALGSTEPVLSEFTRARSALAPLVLSKAERSEAGVPEAVVIVGVDLQWLSRIAAETGAASNVTVNVVGPEGTLLVRYPPAPDIVGRNFSESPLFKAAISADEGNAHVVGFDGTRRYVAFAKFAGTGLRIILGMDEARIIAPIDREIFASTALHATVVLIVLIITWIVADRLVVRPIQRLAADVAEVGAHEGAVDGGLGAHMVSDVGVQEFAPLVEAFADLGQRLADRTTELRSLNGRLAALARTDGLTGLANRRTFDVQLSEDWVRSRDARQPLAVIMLDVDNFKQYNDSLGHLAGDEALRAVARMLIAAVAGTPYLAARYGGEEFVVLLPNADLAIAREFGEEVRKLIAALGIEHPAVVSRRLTASAGVAATIPGEADSPDALLAAADMALYEAKGRGRNMVMAHWDGAQAAIARS